MSITASHISAVLSLKDQFSGKMSGPIGALALFSAKASAAAFVLDALVDTISEATRVAIDFQVAMKKIEGLTNASAESTAAWREEIRKLGPAIGKTPQELAEGLYFVASAGQFAKEGFEVLEYSARMSAAGMGDTADVAKTLTAIINAYSNENLDAAHAADILTSVVVEGQAEADELASSFGRVTGIAQAFGISLEEAGAFVSVFTRVVPRADQAVTSLRQLILNLSAPSDEAQKALKRLGLSAEQLRASIREQGLYATMKELIELTHGNVEQLDEIVPRVRALAGMMATAGSQGDKYAKALANIKNPLGALDKATEKAAETTQFQLNRIDASWKTFLNDLGSLWEPILAKAAEYSANLMEIVFQQKKIQDFLPDKPTPTQLSQLGPVVGGGLGQMLGVPMADPRELAMPANVVQTAAEGMLHAFQKLNESGKVGARSFDEWDAAIKKVADTLTGQDVQQDLFDLQAAWDRLTPAERANQRVVENLVSAYDKIRGSLTTLDPRFERLRNNLESLTRLEEEQLRIAQEYEDYLLKQEGTERDAIDKSYQDERDKKKKEEEDHFKALEEEALRIAKTTEDWELAQQAEEAATSFKLMREELERSTKLLTFAESLEAAFAKMPSVIMRAFTGGGDVLKGIGGLLGGGIFGSDTKLMEGITAKLRGKLGETFGGLLSSIIPGLGTVLGGLGGDIVGKLLGGLFHSAEEKVNDLRDEWLASFGGWENVAEQLAAAGSPEIMQRIFDAKTVEQFQAAVQDAEGAMQEFKRQQDLLVEAQNLLWETIDKYGIKLDQLPEHLQFQKVLDEALGLLKEWEVLLAGGIDPSVAATAMSDAFNDLFRKAQETGAALPAQFEAIFQTMIDLGLLVDEDGNKIESLDGITFTDSLEQGVRDTIDAIYELINTLRELNGLPRITVGVDVETRHTTPSGDGSGTPDDTGRRGGGKDVFAATGFEGWVNTPTTFHVAEAGPEFVRVSPAGQQEQRAMTFAPTIAPQFHVSVQGGDEQAAERLARSLSPILEAEILRLADQAARRLQEGG